MDEKQLRRWLELILAEDPKRRKQFVADITGLPYATVNRVIRGKRKGDIRSSTILRMARRMQVPGWYVLKMVDNLELPPAFSPDYMQLNP